MKQFYTDGITTHDTCITKDDRIYGYWMSNIIGVSLVILDTCVVIPYMSC
ncbi:hypothetical protein CLV25_11490 [Acetobacteroides hydrogenigenes]|uniref:Uncharacterized protein n=1 Tax=Acetobacteroides hydrogenigenes TaxID=979970 RepID=A0A4R2E762_9BACT|nr:hypothetical protein CLV25_11490 [Acetobacteroides hydrogenigenes]